MKLYDYQIEAVNKMKNGCILCGGVGSGKSRTSLAYYYKCCGGDVEAKNRMTHPIDLYVITTARKRDTLEWEGEFGPFGIGTDIYKTKVTVDSWNNIAKYKDVEGAFFIFDEQRVVGYGAWTKSFLKIAKRNQWILLSATPGDTWMDYMPVFIANGFYRNKSDFVGQHVVYDWRTKFPRVKMYLQPGKLLKERNDILVSMDFHRPTESHHEDVFVEYDKQLYRQVQKLRADPETEEPITNASQYCYCLRKIQNADVSRQNAVLDIFEEHPRVIVFYNFDYELEILRNLPYGNDVTVTEWNGHLHQDIPKTGRWVYLVNYGAGAEGWNCITTDTVIFYSQSYSYRTTQQAAGRIDRLNTPFHDLYFYHLKCKTGIDSAIAMALHKKQRFNESGFYITGG